MIRPLTCLAFLLACGSGLYLYQSKHSVHVVDQQIDRTIKATETLREQTRMLHAEWTLLNDPERVRQLSDQFLTLKTVAPTQFTSLADLDSRLPPPAPIPPPTEAAPTPALQPEPAPLVAAAATEGTPFAQADLQASDLPVPPPVPAAPPPTRIATATTPVEQPRPPERISSPSRPVLAQPAPSRVVTADSHPVEARAEPRIVEARPLQPRPVAVAAPVGPPPAAYTGSLLGMARGAPGVPAPLPPPRPMPVNASQFVYNQGG